MLVISSFSSSEWTSAIQVRGEELDSSAAELELVDPVISLFEEIRVFQPCACRQAPVRCCRATDACSLSLRCVFSLCTHLDAHHHFMAQDCAKNTARFQCHQPACFFPRQVQTHVQAEHRKRTHRRVDGEHFGRPQTRKGEVELKQRNTPSA